MQLIVSDHALGETDPFAELRLREPTFQPEAPQVRAEDGAVLFSTHVWNITGHLVILSLPLALRSHKM